MAMNGPRSEERGEDRFVQCEQDLDAEFQALIWRAIKAGWDEGEAAVAVASLADHHILAMQANHHTQLLLDKIRR